MKLFLSFLLCTLMVHLIQSEPEKCLDRTECVSTDYQSYVNCIRRRHKRSLDCVNSCNSDNCIDTCGDCDCNSCNYNNCQNSCNSCCSSCCSNYIPCRTNHCCHKTCQAQCKSTGCRSVCRKNCFESVKQTEEVVNKESPSNTSNVSVNEYRANVTTVIHLNNVINNTHVIEVPVSINYTNQQNISLHSGGYSDDGSGNSTDKCCIVISPRQCVPHKEYPFIRCFHYRSRQCGDYCTASIIHKEQRQVCQSIYPGAQPNCYQQIIYIPQPQPRCTYQSSWPYVACGIQKSASCSGCYNHYVNENSKAYTTCPTGCYDEGFGIGPYYRQGPVYRPTYFHTPPCFQCDNFGAYGGNGGYAGYGGYAGPVGYGGGYGGFPPVGIPGFGTGTPQLPEMSLGSWSPGEVNSFGTGNQSTFNSSDIVSFDPLISVGPGFSNPMGYIDPFRASREVEIEVDYEPPSSVQAEVKIQTNKTEEQGMTSDEIRKASTPS